MVNLTEISDEFIEYCRAKNLSEHTLRAYRQDLNDFLIWGGKCAHQNPFAKDTMMGWMMDMRERGLGPASIKRRIACLKVLCRWLEEDERIEDNPFHKFRANVRLPRRLPRNLYHEELKVLFGSRSVEGHEHFGATMSLILELLFTTGIRVGELCQVRIHDINLGGNSIAIQGKGNRERRVFLVDDIIKCQIKAYYKVREQLTPRTDGLLLTTRGTAITPDYVRRMLRKHVENLKLKRRITPHMLRHSAATQLLESGVDIRFVQKLLGHASISTTEIYTHVSDSRLQEAIRTANPRSQLDEHRIGLEP
ncbi:MAG: tyrosine-type recombinase/integrase [Magnetovibrio sp.]|nr:tyrosine-type recombinase/integrase [Magnetovibrio sp.]